jgi:Autographiviridae endonuclease I
VPYFHKKKRKGPYKSGLEGKFVVLAEKKKVAFKYEVDTFSYVVPSHYTPDFKIADKTYIETKGYLSPSNRQRLICFKEQHPDITICLLFGNADNKLNSKSKTTYREWAKKHGFPCADIRDGLPLKWWGKNDGNKKTRKTKS